MHDLSQFDDVIDQVRSGLSAVTYQRPSPAVRARARRLRSLAGAATVAAAVTALVVLEPWGMSSAAWADHPAELTAEQEARITRVCTDLGHRPGEASPPLPSTAVIDWRGSKVIAFFADDDRMVECVLDAVRGDDFEDPRGGAVSGDHAPSDLRVVHDDPRISYVLSGVESSVRVGDRFMMLVGRVSPEVDRVAVDIPGRGEAAASMNSGWISIWWPGTHEGTTLVAYDAQGQMLARVPVTYE
jgi:hypothetical protein